MNRVQIQVRKYFILMHCLLGSYHLISKYDQDMQLGGYYILFALETKVLEKKIEVVPNFFSSSSSSPPPWTFIRYLIQISSNSISMAARAMAAEVEEEDAGSVVVGLGSYRGKVRVVSDCEEEIMLLWAIQQPIFSKNNAFVRQSSLQLNIDACGRSLSILQSPSSLVRSLVASSLSSLNNFVSIFFAVVFFSFYGLTVEIIRIGLCACLDTEICGSTVTLLLVEFFV